MLCRGGCGPRSQCSRSLWAFTQRTSATRLHDAMPASVHIHVAHATTTHGAQQISNGVLQKQEQQRVNPWRAHCPYMMQP